MNEIFYSFLFFRLLHIFTSPFLRDIERRARNLPAKRGNVEQSVRYGQEEGMSRKLAVDPVCSRHTVVNGEERFRREETEREYIII